jgi:SpoIID/LytB domain protein
VVLDLGDRTLDNREYWIVTTPFETLKAAKDYAQNYDPPGQAMVVNDVITPSQGELSFEDRTVSRGVRIIPKDPDAFMYLHDVTVGIEFHWQHKRTQKIPGVLEVRINNEGALVGINELNIESYLISVNSSEMTSENPPELLNAQTVAARSTILATMGKHHYDASFHLCSDDHCQCYHGFERISEASETAARSTQGENVTYDGAVCDARYSKICGGVIEDYRYVWDDRHVPYLVADVDGKESIDIPLDTEEKARAHIDGDPDVYCNTHRYNIDSALPYDTTELFHWLVEYSRDELQALLVRKLDQDFGELIDLIPGERAPSGRLIYLDIVGSKKTLRVGKELAIRRALSESHLYSSCFYIDRDLDDSGTIHKFHLHGAGWGHGVGLCQVGATVMAQLGFDYKQILTHYYKGVAIERLY